MKDFVAKLKGLDYKQLAIEHGDKAVFGIVALFIMICLVGTSWSRYEKAPKEFSDKVDTESAELLSSKWPEAKRDQYDSITDLGEAVEELFTPLSVTKFEYGTPYTHPLYKPQEKIREPEWLAVEFLLADSSSVIVEYRPEKPDRPTINNSLIVVVEEENIGATRPVDPNAPRSGTVRNVDTGSDPEEDDADTSEGEDEDEGFEDEDSADTEGTGEGDEDDAFDYGGGGGAGGIPVATINAEWRRFVSVRGLVPLKKQLDKFALALNIDVPAKAAELLEYVEFELQRQTAIEGPDPWVQDWEPVDIQVAIDVLDTVADYDADVISSVLTDPVFTMPLPRRLAGEWDNWASHRKLTTLSKVQREQQMLENQKAIEELAKEKLKTRKTVRKGGFSKNQHDIRGTRRRLGSNMASIRKLVMDEMSSAEYRSYLPGMTGRRGLPSKGAHAKLAGQWLLFRFLDFSVEPGNAYRYRVRLIIRNPNYDRPIEDLVNPDFAKGEIRPTPWSNMTAPVEVKSDVQYFLTKVSAGPPQINANIRIFEWYAKAGTYVMGDLKKIVPGQLIAAYTQEDRRGKITGGIETEVLRPANQTLRVEENVEIATRNVLLDIDDRLDISEEDHRALELDFRHIRNHLSPEQAIVVNQYGELELLDSASQQTRLRKANALLDRERSPWLNLVSRNTRNSRRSRIDDLLDEDSADMEDGDGGRRSRTPKRRGRNPIRRRR
ncbi:MAG: hypothetical protein O7F71_00655 [Gammaproteobacteria bacterium]|nr:hypothetical protein [Gammaproteobacteria bacterium]